MMLAYQPIRSLATINMMFYQGATGAERVFKVLDTKEFISDEGTVIKDKVEGTVEYKNVKFAYKKEEWVLQGLS